MGKRTARLTFSISDVLKILLCLQIWNTYTILLGYSTIFRWGTVLCILLEVILVKGCIVNGRGLSKGQIIWIVSVIYFWVGCIYSVDRNSTMTYCVSISTASFILFIVLKTRFYTGCYNLLYGLLIFSLATVYLNFFVHDLMTRYFSFLIPESIRNTVVSDVLAGAYSGIFADRANAAFGLNIGFAISYIKYITKQKKGKKYLILSGLFWVGIILTGKRTLAIIPAILVLASMLIKSRNQRKNRIYVALIVICLAIIFILTAFPQSISFFFRGDSDDLLNSRGTVLWPVAIQMFMSHKLFGTGINTYNTILNQSNLNNSTLSTWSSHAHNIYIQILGETGILGLILIVSFIFLNLNKTMYLLKRQDNKERNTLLLISLSIQLIWSIYGLTGNTFYYSQQLLCYIFCVATMEAISNEKNRYIDIS